MAVHEKVSRNTKGDADTTLTWAIAPELGNPKSKSQPKPPCQATEIERVDPPEPSLEGSFMGTSTWGFQVLGVALGL